MKRKSDRLALVKNVFEKRENAVAQQLGQFQTTLNQAVEQLALLREHRDQQAESMRDGATTDPSRLQNQIAFLQRLNDAIVAQEQVIERAKNDREELRRRWLASRRRTQSVEKLTIRRRDADLRDESRSEQKQQDELSARLTAPDD